MYDRHVNRFHAAAASALLACAGLLCGCGGGGGSDSEAAAAQGYTGGGISYALLSAFGTQEGVDRVQLLLRQLGSGEKKPEDLSPSELRDLALAMKAFKDAKKARREERN